MPRQGSRYNYRHEQVRANLKPTVDRGEADCTEPICLMPTRWIQPGTPWDLAHDDDGIHYRGAAHAICNRSEGGKRGAQITNQQPPIASRAY